MNTGEVLLTFAGVCLGSSIMLALLFRFWPGYGSVEAAIQRADDTFEHMETASQAH
jgi:hypothetical protein